MGIRRYAIRWNGGPAVAGSADIEVEDRNGKPGWPALAAMRDMAIVAGIYAYFAGATYLIYYFRFFGISEFVVGTSYESTLTVASNVFAQPYAIVTKALALLFVGSLSAAAYKIPRHRTVIAWSTAVILFPIIQVIAARSAQQIAMARLETGAFDRVAFTFRQGVQAPVGWTTSVSDVAPEWCLVHQTSERYFVISCSASPAQPRRVLEVRSSDVAFAAISSNARPSPR
jgi:hypothetical protein